MGKENVVTAENPSKKLPLKLCILHDPSLSQHGNFTNLSSSKGDPDDKLSYIHDISDLRHSEPVTSPYRLNDICDQITPSLGGLPLNTTGCHQNCYKHFTINLDILKKSNASGSSESSSSQIKISYGSTKHSQMGLMGRDVPFCFRISVFFVKR